ncbi:MAG: primosomal protein N' (replication factor Y) - superfamily II helicase [Gammaproteobacteria bacterium]|nr:primosomal protein N' (replication factor Y) - superfamily II helicase [Gammaproteobacteria bacterium]NNF61053.1 primosomal protein N' (replication factor Y) - superfamily II helicase [Gammaproteobacteria bacterium]NNM21434.1 primosomal protein N' (replication factor Y) - superfamily II helicase [Gammaproteobacteria bacterium]
MPSEVRAPGTDQFPCERCGALQTFQPGTDQISCPYCGHTTDIESGSGVLREYGFREALSELAQAPPAEERETTQCESCAAEFDLGSHIHAGECPFCGTPVVEGTGTERHIKPESLLPFEIDEEKALASFRKWLGKLWFAPGSLRRYAEGDARLTGVYVPYWTYDSATVSRYRGQRGTIYHVPQTYTTVVNGRRVTRTRMVQKVRWRPASGRVSRFFDDVLVGASRSLPRKITDRLAPWDLANLVSYDERYLSGFRSEAYQVGLDEGFKTAIQIMDRVIRQDVARDIGGDLQRITHVDTRHSETTFKHLLLPVWSAAFRFRNKVYRFVVNGRTGKVQGERPYSKFKIAAAAVAAAIVVVIVLVLGSESGVITF